MAVRSTPRGGRGRDGRASGRTASRRNASHSAQVREAERDKGRVLRAESRSKEFAEAGASPLPESGDEIGPYRLRRELGRGGFARVFLAEQTDLADRLVVLKISRRPSHEPRLMARVRHPHIVEVLREGFIDGESLHLIAMPFLGGATLDSALTRGRRRGRPASTGREFLADLDHVSAAEHYSRSTARPARELLAKLSYAKSVAWILARLAEALDHSHSRGVVHGDLKPSNILLTADCQPMLLDFNLAVNDADPESLDPGGTLAYMAPERLEIVAGLKSASRLSRRERRRADLYSLGLILLEALTARAPRPRTSGSLTLAERARDLIAQRPWTDSLKEPSQRCYIPSPLRAVLDRCLAADPKERYERASDLAEDLDLWRNDRPLIHAGIPVWRQGLVCWTLRRRAPISAATLSIAAALIATSLVWNSFLSTFQDQALKKLALVWDQSDSDAIGYRQTYHWPGIEREDPGVKALRHLARYSVLGDSDWRRRDDVENLPEEERGELELWLNEQLLRLVRALRERPDSPNDWRRALEYCINESQITPFNAFLNEAALLRQKLALAPTSNLVQSPAEISTWANEYLLGVDCETAHPLEAYGHYLAALRSRPGSFWVHQRSAVVAYRLGKFRDAAEHLKHCVAIRPMNARLRDQFAGCLFQLSRYDEVSDQCDKALEIDRDNIETYRTRCYLWNRLGHLDDLQRDLRRFAILTRTLSQSPSKRLEFQIAALTRTQLEPEEALDWAAFPSKLLALQPEDLDLRLDLGIVYWQASRFEEAVNQFESIIEIDPDYLPARLLRGLLLCRLDDQLDASRSQEGIRELALLLDHPRFEELVAHRRESIRAFHLVARDRFRHGRLAEALELGERGLSLAERTGLDVGESHYALARTYIQAAKGDPSAFQKAVEHLLAARTCNAYFVSGWFEADKVFDPTREVLRPLLTRVEAR